MPFDSNSVQFYHSHFFACLLPKKKFAKSQVKQKKNIIQKERERGKWFDSMVRARWRAHWLSTILFLCAPFSDRTIVVGLPSSRYYRKHGDGTLHSFIMLTLVIYIFFCTEAHMGFPPPFLYTLCFSDVCNVQNLWSIAKEWRVN